jgi:hypothetical protein
MLNAHTSSLAVAFAALLSSASPAFAQAPGDSVTDNQPQQTPTPAAQTFSDDDRVPRAAEPDFRIINLPTTERLPVGGGNFDLTHRFAGNLRRGSFGDQASQLFGIDEGAVVGFEYRYGVMRHLEAVAYRNAFQRTIQLYAKYDAVRQDSRIPVSMSALVSVEGTDNFRTEYAPAIGASLSRIFGATAALYAVPTWVHNSAASLGTNRETVYIGIGGRVRFRPTVYLVAEMSPRVAGYAPGSTEFGFGIEKRAGRHVFQLNFSNSSGTTFGQTARGGQPETLYLGFNLSRKFF